MVQRERLVMAPETRSPYSSKPITILKHLSHPKHPLHLLYIPSEFLCSGCDALGYGPRYRCEACDFDLHEICATCPASTTTALHPNHHLTLLNDPLSRRGCHLCGDRVRGLFYTCRACDFNVHPLCTQLPLQVQLPLHPHHLLKLQPAPPTPCALCFKACTLWRYRCEACRLDLHLECALGAGPDDVLHPPPPQQVGFPAGGDYGMAPQAMMGQVQQQGNKLERQDSAKSRKKTYIFVARLALNVVSTLTTGVPLGSLLL